MGSFKNRPCLQGVVVRSDRLDLRTEGGDVAVEVLRTSFKHPFVAHWLPSPADVGEERIWAVATHLLVTFRDPVDEVGAWHILNATLRAALHADISYAVQRISLPNTFLVFTPEGGPEITTDGPPDYILAALAAVRHHPAVDDANPNYLYFSLPMSLSASGGCPGTGIADDLKRMQAPLAWRQTIGDGRVRVAVLDSGIQLDHPDLKPNLLRQNGTVVGYNAYTINRPPDDEFGHGTWCAGIIGAIAQVGVNPRVALIPVKFLGPSGCGTVAGAIDGIQFAMNQAAHVISASWGGPCISPDLEKKIAQIASDILFVAGAGNDHRNLDTLPGFYPAGFSLPNILSVGGADDNDFAVATWGYGKKRVHLSAPGRSVCSTYLLGGYRTGDGTSASTAFVAGACALVKAADFSRGVANIRQRILDSVVPLQGSPTGVSCTGGRLDLANAILGTNLMVRPCP